MPAQKNSDIKRPLLILLILLTLCFICGGGFYVYNSFLSHSNPKITTPKITNSQSIIGVSNSNSVQDGYDINFPELSKQPPAQPVRLIISTAPTFKTATEKGSLNIVNHPDNKDLLLQVRIVSKANPDIVYYISPVLEPEQKIEADYLTDKTLTADSYDALAIFDFYHASDKSHYYSVASAITLRIKS